MRKPASRRPSVLSSARRDQLVSRSVFAGLLMLLARSAAHTQARVDPSVAAITRAINDVICEVFGAMVGISGAAVVAMGTMPSAAS